MSKLSDVLNDFNFQEEDKQIAFITNLYLAGYFKPESIWQAINMMQYDANNKKTEIWKKEPQITFANVVKSLQKSGSNQENPEKFNAKELLNSFMNEDEFFSKQNVADMILYLSQNAFDRKKGQERNELEKKPWSDIHQELYSQNAKILGMIEERTPLQKKYDETWIQGASRLRITTRMQSAKEYQKNGIDLGQVRLLTGERELWAEIDKLPNESIDICKEFLLKLATTNNIKLDGFEERVVAGSSRTYPKYAEGETKKLTETLMAKAIYKETFGSEIAEDQVIDSKAYPSESRPTTTKAAVDITREKLLQRIRNQEFTETPLIMIVSNQPYADRQTLSTERAALEEMRKNVFNTEISFEGVGDSCEVGVTAIHSELGALVNEKYMKALMQQKMPEQLLENPDQLSFQRRCKNHELLLPPMPKIIPLPNVKEASLAKALSLQGAQLGNSQ